MNKGKTTSAKHHKRRHTHSMKIRSSPAVKKKLISKTQGTDADDIPQVVQKSNGNGHNGATQLVVHDISKEGMKAFSNLLQQLQSGSGATLLLAHHLSPEHQKQLTELLVMDSKKESAETVQKLQKELATAKGNLDQRSKDIAGIADDLTTVLEAVNEALIIVGSDLCIKRYSRAAEKALSLGPDDIGRKVTGAKLTSQIPGLEEVVSKVIATSSLVQQEVVDVVGSSYLLRASPYRIGEKKNAGMVLALLDIDAEKRGEALSRASQGKEQCYHDVVHGILMTVDVQGNVVKMNKSGCELLGANESDIVGRNWIDEFVPKSHWTVARTIFDQIIKAGLDEQHEYPVATKGGEERVISWQTGFLKDGVGNVTGIICSGEDLTLLRQINTALQKSEERFHWMMESVREDEFFIMDTEGYIVSWIARPEEGKSYRAKEMVGQHFSFLYAPEDFQSGKPMRILDTAESEGRFEEDGWRIRKDGSRMRAYVIIIPIRDEARNLLGFSNVTRYMRERQETTGTSETGFGVPMEFSQQETR